MGPTVDGKGEKAAQETVSKVGTHKLLGSGARSREKTQGHTSLGSSRTLRNPGQPGMENLGVDRHFQRRMHSVTEIPGGQSRRVAGHQLLYFGYLLAGVLLPSTQTLDPQRSLGQPVHVGRPSATTERNLTATFQSGDAVSGQKPPGARAAEPGHSAATLS